MVFCNTKHIAVLKLVCVNIIVAQNVVTVLVYDNSRVILSCKCSSVGERLCILERTHSYLVVVFINVVVTVIQVEYIVAVAIGNVIQRIGIIEKLRKFSVIGFIQGFVIENDISFVIVDYEIIGLRVGFT